MPYDLYHFLLKKSSKKKNKKKILLSLKLKRIFSRTLEFTKKIKNIRESKFLKKKRFG